MDVVVVAGSRILITGTRCLLLTLLAYWSAVSVNTLLALGLSLPPAAHWSGAQLSAPDDQPRKRQPYSAYAIVYTRDIFNSAKAPRAAATKTASASNARFTLWGTAGRQAGPAFAILADTKTRGQKLFREGESLAPGLKLARVAWDRVILERDGRSETLMLPTDMTPASPAAPSRATRARVKANFDDVNQMSGTTFKINRRAIGAAMTNMADLFKSVRAVPFTSTEGQSQGFRLFSIKADSLVDRLGLKNGDVVQRVNGVELTDAGTALSLLQDLDGMARVEVDVLRNHQPVTLSYEID